MTKQGLIEVLCLFHEDKCEEDCDKCDKHIEELLNKYVDDEKAEMLDEMKALLPKCDRVNGYVCPLPKDDCFDCMYEALERISLWIKAQVEKVR